VSEKQCRCYEGFGGGNTPDEACTICPAGTYSANQGTEKCMPCQFGFTSVEGAKNRSECFAVDTCPAGTGELWPKVCSLPKPINRSCYMMSQSRPDCAFTPALFQITSP